MNIVYHFVSICTVSVDQSQVNVNVWRVLSKKESSLAREDESCIKTTLVNRREHLVPTVGPI